MINLHNSKIIIKNPNELICVRQFAIGNGGIFVFMFSLVSKKALKVVQRDFELGENVRVMELVQMEKYIS